MTITSSKVLAVRVDIFQMQRLLTFVRDRIVRRKKFIIVTPNPEIILQAQNDPDLMKIINSSDISLLDSVGVLMALKFLKEPFGPVIKGRKAFIELIRLANKKSWKVYLLGGEPGVCLEAAKRLSLNFKEVRFKTSSGPRLDNHGVPVTERDIMLEKEVIIDINKFSPELLFVGFGAPKQEKWLAANIKNLNIGGSMVVGGAFDYISGLAKLPPRWMEQTGLEWLWRLISQPWRTGRIFKAVIEFPIRVFLSKVQSLSRSSAFL